MSRELIITVQQSRPSESMMDVYGHGANTVIGELVERMKVGATVAPDARVENVHLHDKDGNHIGFNFYLVAGEPVRMGPPRIEVEGGLEDTIPA